MELSSRYTPHKPLLKRQTAISASFQHCRCILLVCDFKTLGRRIETLPKGLVGINKMINTRQYITLSLMSGHFFRWTGTPTGSAFLVFPIIALATFSLTGMHGLPSVRRTDNSHDRLCRSPYDALCTANQATAWCVFDDVRICEVGIHPPERLLRAAPSGVRDRFFMPVGACQDIGIRLPSITEQQRGFTITVPWERLDQWLGLFLGPFPMMPRMPQPTARPAVDKRPSIAPVLSFAFVVAAPGFF
jgi:hypothetical protein